MCSRRINHSWVWQRRNQFAATFQKFTFAISDVWKEVPWQQQEIVRMGASFRFRNDGNPRSHRVFPPLLWVAFGGRANQFLVEPKHLQKRVAFGRSAISVDLLSADTLLLEEYPKAIADLVNSIAIFLVGWRLLERQAPLGSPCALVPLTALKDTR